MVDVAVGLLAVALSILPAQMDPVRPLVISGEASCSQCRLLEAGRTVLGSPGDSLAIPGLPRVAAFGDGSAVVISDLLPLPGALVYSSAGVLERSLRVSGLRQVVRVATAPNGQVFLRDVVLGAHVVDPNGRLLRRLPHVTPSLGDPLFVGDGTIVVFGNRPPTSFPDRQVHVYSSMTGRVLGAVGPRRDLRPGEHGGARAVAASGDSAVWLVEAPNRVSLWRVDDRKVGEIRFDPSWLGSVDERLADVRADEEYAIHDLWEEPGGELLWIASVVEAPDAGSTRPGGVGEPIPGAALRPHGLNQSKVTVVSVLHFGTGRILVHDIVDEVVYQYLEDGRVVVMAEDGEGTFRINLVRFELTRR